MWPCLETEFRERFMQNRKARSAHTASLSKRKRPAKRKVARAISASRPGEDGSSKGMLLGYARVSTIDQNLALQRDALAEAGCGRIFTEQLSGAVTDRPALRDALEFARSGDTLIVWKLDRLARSMKQLIDTIENLRVRGIGFRSLTEALDTTTAQGRLVFHMFGALAEFERSLIRDAPKRFLRMQDIVDILREREGSWATIGQALAVSRPAAWKRFGGGV